MPATRPISGQTEVPSSYDGAADKADDVELGRVSDEIDGDTLRFSRVASDEPPVLDMDFPIEAIQFEDWTATGRTSWPDLEPAWKQFLGVPSSSPA